MNSYLMDYWKWLTKALNGGVIKACLRDICDIMNLSREFSMMKIDVKSFRISAFIDKTLSLFIYCLLVLSYRSSHPTPASFVNEQLVLMLGISNTEIVFKSWINM